MTSAVHTRRDAVRRTAALGGAIMVAAALPEVDRPAPALAQEDDATAIDMVLSLQQTALIVYDVLASGGSLDGRAARVARLLREHERVHVRTLAEALEQAGGSPPEPPSRRSVEGLAELRSQTDALRFAIDLETRAMAASYDAAGQLASAGALVAVAGVAASDAQHLVLLRQAAGMPPLPEAFVTGAPVL